MLSRRRYSVRSPVALSRAQPISTHLTPSVKAGLAALAVLGCLVTVMLTASILAAFWLETH